MQPSLLPCRLSPVPMQYAGAFADGVSNRFAGLKTSIRVERSLEASIADPDDDDDVPLRQIIPVVKHGEHIKGSVVLTAPPGQRRVIGGARQKRETLRFRTAAHLPSRSTCRRLRRPLADAALLKGYHAKAVDRRMVRAAKARGRDAGDADASRDAICSRRGQDRLHAAVRELRASRPSYSRSV